MKPYLKTAALSTDERVDQLVSEMTLAEKVAQLQGVWVTDLIDRDRAFVYDKTRARIPDGVGQITRLGGATLLGPSEIAALGNEIQRYLIEGTRLGIPAIVHEESCAGFMIKGATTYPQAIGLAATWQPNRIQVMADQIRQQMRAVGAHHALAPVLDVVRDPRWGRLEETFGEDTFLVSAFGLGYVNGIQGTDLKRGVAATAKHFVGYSWSEGGLNWAPSHIPARELREVFLTPFKAVIKQGKIVSVMNAYHEHDGVPCGSSRELLTELLRDEIGFEGVVVADYFTINMFVNYHHIAANKGEAARLALEAGIDVELPAIDCYGAPLLEALERGEIDPELVNIGARRVLRQKFDMGLFENPYVDTGRIPEIYSNPEAISLSRELAGASMVLLKNDGLLPLSPTLSKIAVIGPSADSPRLMQGDYHYPGHLEGVADLGANAEAPSPQQVLQVNWDEHFPPSVTVLGAVKARVSAETQVSYARGCDILDPDTSGFAEAVEAAKAADVAIVVVGDRSGLRQGATSGEAIDRATLELPGVQQDLVQAIAATGTPVVLVLFNGRPPVLTAINDQIAAILEGWLPAEQGGNGVVDVLFGDVNPGGKLPVSFPRSVGQIPLYYNHKPSGGRSHWHGSYIDELTTPLYPFGHGLSYTSFEFAALTFSNESVTPTGETVISCDVTNTGAVAGDEVVQLYLYDELASVTRPVKMLKGFQRVTLEPGETQRVSFTIDARHLAFYDRAMRYVVEPGVIQVMIGASSTDIRLGGQFTINGETTEVEQVYTTPVQVETVQRAGV